MIYCQTISKECIEVRPLNNIKNAQYVEFIKYGDIHVFAVCMNDGEKEWTWEFDMSNPSDYERVKMNTFDAIFECDTMLELAEALDSIYRDGFEDILVVDECAECGGCNGCWKHECK